MRIISLKLPDALLRRLESEARIRRVTKSQLVRTSLERALAEGKEGKQASCYDLARDLAGKLKGLPKDLATNPAYLKGFDRREAAWARESEWRIDALDAGKLTARDAATVISELRKGLRK